MVRARQILRLRPQVCAVGRHIFTWAEANAADMARHEPGDVFRAGVRQHHIANTAFPIGHTQTVKPYRVPRTRAQEELHRVVNGAYGHLDELMLYAHVPFCPVRCQFCEYTVVDPRVGVIEDVQTRYFKALRKEMEMYSAVLGGTKSKRVVGFDIGGGTPSMARSAEIESLIDTVDRLYNFDPSQFEISIETTPRIAATEPQKLKDYYAMGIRRISMGLQTTDFKQAQELGRDDANGQAHVVRALENVRSAGFDSFNVDLMYGFPLPPSASRSGIDPWGQTVQDCIDLAPEHITLYRMRYKGTNMAHLQNRVDLDQVNTQAFLAYELLTNNGYDGMIGKNTYSKINSGCSDYLDKRVREAVPYLGFGLGAQSFSHFTLAYNLGAVTKSMNQYLKSVDLNRLPIQDLYHLPRELAMGKMVSVSFYYGGIDLLAFEHCFNISLEAVFPDAVQFLLDNGLMEYTDASGNLPGRSRFQLTPSGKGHFGGCVALFYSPAVQNYLMSLGGGEHFAGDPVDALRQEDHSDLSISMGSDVEMQTVPITFVGGGDVLQVDATVGRSLYDVAREHGAALEAACRGECACSTCHVKLPSQGVQPPTEEEQDMIELAFGSDATSRLACQLQVEESMRGVCVVIPDDVLTTARGLKKKQMSPLAKKTSPVKDAMSTTSVPNSRQQIAL
jgi:oxygen-independent coproporphyrinogen-3 oxidase